MKRNMKWGICLVLTEAMLLTGCSSNQLNTKSNTTANKATTIEVTSSKGMQLTLDSLREKYGETTADYAKESITVERGQNIEYPIGFQPYADIDRNIKDCFTLYQDDQLKYQIKDCSYDYDADSGNLIISPPTFGFAEPTTRAGSDIDLSDLSGNYLYSDNTGDNWGNLKQLYLVQNCDAKTGEPLTKPIIHIVKIKSELKQAPVVTYSSNENGEAYISWNPVEGAKEYLLFTVDKTETGIDSYSYVFGRTSDTSWTAPNMDGTDGKSYRMNEMFSNYITSDDDVEGGMDDMNEDFFEKMQANVGVIAITENGASPISDLYPVKEYGKLLPNCVAHHATKEQDAESLFRNSIENLPAETSVTMCDGSTSPRVLEYDFDHATLETETSVPKLHIKAVTSGTKFYDEYTAVVDDVNSVDSALDALKKRQEGLKNKAGSVDKDVTVQDDAEEEAPETTNEPVETTSPEQTSVPEESTTPEETVQPEVSLQPTETAVPSESITPEESSLPEQTDTPMEPTTPAETTKPATSSPEAATSGDHTLEGNTDLKVTANSALSEYIARAMLASSTSIDISAFTESKNTDIVVDAVFEAQYQNPLVLGIKGITYDGANAVLAVEYYDSTEQLEEKRNAVINKSKEVISTIIKDGMSDLQKETAINDYLCQNGTYDDAALENAKQYNFKKIDDQYQDSFTPYGILINGVGVCASYAGSFKVLADEAGLECIVVTGNLNGNLSHAWNRVKVDNEWRTVDATNNDNDIINNALFNVPDAGINGVLTADDRYVVDDQLDSYTCKNEDDEYYHYNSKFYKKDAIVDKFVESLGQEEQSVLRTDYTITDEDFTSIANSVAQKMQKDLKGYYWLGVINLSK